jgi:acetyl-CoA C-acetyltransferase
VGEAFIVAAVRTAGGRRGGRLRDWHPADLGGHVLNAVIARAGIDPIAVDDVVFGCVTQAGEQSQHVGRNAVLAAGLPQSIPAVTIDRQCGSSQQGIHFASQAVMSGTQDVVIAGGVESMTRVPMLLATSLADQAGVGTGPVPQSIKDRYGIDGFSQFLGAQMVADKHGLSRDELDRYALESHRRAAAAIAAGAFDAEIVPVPINLEGVADQHVRDEGVRLDASYEAICSVKPLVEGGAISAANASQVCDGAAAVLIANERGLRTHGLTPLARVHNLTVTAGDPVIMLEEPLMATKRALERAGLKLQDIDLCEVNEAFASVPLAWLKALGADPARLNVNGGAIALGHPLGATGAKLMATLVHALRARGGRYGLQAMCEGGGIANVTIIEALH